MKKIAGENEFDFISIGAGPAGLTAVQYASRSGLRSLAIDASVVGGQVLSIANLENYPGIFSSKDSFPCKNGFELIEAMQNQAESFGAKIIQARATALDKIGPIFFIETDRGTFSSKAVAIATGAEHKKLNIPGEHEFEGRGVSYCAICDGPLFKDKNIFVVGGGDSACDEALYLATLSEHITLVHRRNKLRAQKILVSRVAQNKNIRPMLNSVLKEIHGTDRVHSVIIASVTTGKEREFDCDAVFVAVGTSPRCELFSILQKDSGGHVVTDENMRTTIPGLYAIGDVRSKPLRQIVTAANDGAIAAFDSVNYIRQLKINSEYYFWYKKYER